ncbi:hypothetical protein VIGAN_09020700, partial [Vigna angularis var. angularis]
FSFVNCNELCELYKVRKKREEKKEKRIYKTKRKRTKTQARTTVRKINGCAGSCRNPLASATDWRNTTPQMICGGAHQHPSPGPILYYYWYYYCYGSNAGSDSPEPKDSDRTPCSSTVPWLRRRHSSETADVPLQASDSVSEANTPSNSRNRTAPAPPHRLNQPPLTATYHDPRA